MGIKVVITASGGREVTRDEVVDDGVGRSLHSHIVALSFMLGGD